jgi:hypothetical protein
MSATPPIPLGSFDPAGVVVTYNGSTIIGLAKGTFVKVARDSVLYTDDVGSNGDPIRVKNNDQRGAIELTLMQSSPSCDFLANQAAVDELSGTGIGAVEVVDLNGRSVASGQQAWVEKMADAEYGTEASTRMFKLRVGKLRHFVGGIV